MTLYPAAVHSQGVATVSLLPGGKHIALAMEWHTPLTADKGSLRSFADAVKPDDWRVSRIILAIRHLIEHYDRKLPYTPLKHALGNPKADKGSFKA